ncbi:hypothetical protein P7K49_009925 [Saguinus oedipus]|uniref:Uncharacterized protein n=1 Tax=Saguinus oedipus TaxID=9490 RepID=A0ABQ9VLE2_SAGOE|nr:hypothetical protein P7K49_009925 [Saguinus oedipus]
MLHGSPMPAGVVFALHLASYFTDIYCACEVYQALPQAQKMLECKGRMLIFKKLLDVIITSKRLGTKKEEFGSGVQCWRESGGKRAGADDFGQQNFPKFAEFLACKEQKEHLFLDSLKSSKHSIEAYQCPHQSTQFGYLQSVTVFAAAEESKPSRWPSNPLLNFINHRKTLSECKDASSLETM